MYNVPFNDLLITTCTHIPSHPQLAHTHTLTSTLSTGLSPRPQQTATPTSPRASSLKQRHRGWLRHLQCHAHTLLGGGAKRRAGQLLCCTGNMVHVQLQHWHIAFLGCYMYCSRNGVKVFNHLCSHLQWQTVFYIIGAKSSGFCSHLQ